MLDNRRILIRRAKRPFLYKGRTFESKHQHPNWILSLSTSHSPLALPIAFSLATSPACPKPPTPLFLPVPTWNAFGLNNIIQSLSQLILRTEEVWPDSTLVLGWYPAPHRPAIRIRPIQPLESTLVSTRWLSPTSPD